MVLERYGAHIDVEVVFQKSVKEPRDSIQREEKGQREWHELHAFGTYDRFLHCKTTEFNIRSIDVGKR